MVKTREPIYRGFEGHKKETSSEEGHDQKSLRTTVHDCTFLKIF